MRSLQSWWAGEVMFIYVPRLQCRTLSGPMFQGLPHTIKMKHFVGDYLPVTISSRLSNSVLSQQNLAYFTSRFS